MIRRGTKPYLFVLSNDGYEIERQSESPPRRSPPPSFPLHFGPSLLPPPRFSLRLRLPPRPSARFGPIRSALTTVHGKNAKYNNIQMYNHQELLPFLGGTHPEVPIESIRVSTQGELQALLEDPAFAKADKIRLVEIMMPRGDAPEGLIKQAQLTAQANAEA